MTQERRIAFFGVLQVVLTASALTITAADTADPWVDPAVSPATPSFTSINSIRMLEVAEVPWSTTVLSTSQGFDIDNDTKREFVIKIAEAGTSSNGRFEFYECTANNSFALVHVLDITDEGSFVSFYPGDFGDADGDGLADLAVFGRIVNDFYVRLYESAATGTYPTDLAWEVGGHVSEGFSWPVGAVISETDGDGWLEVVIGGVFDSVDKVVVYENDGDDFYRQIYSVDTEIGNGYSMGVVSDLDGDGRDEILFGGSGFERDIVAYESTGDDTYEEVWTAEFNPLVNVNFIIDAGDLDNDGKKEFLAGGYVTTTGDFRLDVFEVVGDNEVQVVATLSRSDSNFLSDANVADVDGDGRKEIVFGSTWGFSIYQNSGDNTWSEIWSGPAGPIESIGAGDHDQDGKEEIIVRDGNWTEGVTTIFEIHPADAADMDHDGAVDVIDNCPTVFNLTQSDADGDDVGDACDNCIYGPNPEQGPAIFGQEIIALNSEMFSWSEPAETAYVRGDLALVDMYVVDVFENLPLGTSLDDPTPPGSGEGFYYLVKPDCAVGSWQTTLGAEPERDTEFP